MSERQLEDSVEVVEVVETKEYGGNGQGAGGGKYRLTGSMAAKICAFFLLASACLVALESLVACVYMWDRGYYSLSLEDALMEEFYDESRSVAYLVRRSLELGNMEGAEEICRTRNVGLELVWVEGQTEKETVLWSAWEGDETDLYSEVSASFSKDAELVLNRHTIKAEERYFFRVHIDPEFPKEDNFKRIADLIMPLYGNRYTLIGVGIGCFLVCVICFVFLMCSAGHRNGWEGVVPGVLSWVYLDVLTVFYAFGAAVILLFTANIGGFRIGGLARYALASVGLTVLAVWGTLYCMELALRMKLGNFWRHSLIYAVLRWGWRLACALCRGCAVLLGGIPTVINTVVVCLGLCVFEFLVIAVYMRRGEVLLLWGIEKAVLLPVILYLALVCRRLLEAGRALAEGREDYVVDTAGMFGDFKEHGESLNSLARGISRAVEERMKSERLKTELITNVSHDLKTPLTSIINYADLICEEPVDNPKVGEYAEVLLRQSRRLKKLLEDLVEASKAATGNVEVNLEPCQAGVLLSQAVGEYQKRMQEKGLELIARQPQEPVEIMADGRHLWRVFDNLLNNICKYAQENSRVYLSVEAREREVLIIFRNMSKYPLEIPAGELAERFVRGDKSRHMEGNGLGLSIAWSLVEMQGGKMDIVTDGDLFKVTLSFGRLASV